MSTALKSTQNSVEVSVAKQIVRDAKWEFVKGGRTPHDAVTGEFLKTTAQVSFRTWEKGLQSLKNSLDALHIPYEVETTYISSTIVVQRYKDGKSHTPDFWPEFETLVQEGITQRETKKSPGRS